MEVKARLFLRENVTKLGLAPLTSMYLFGENQPSAQPDFRPEVHDSDGLSVQLGTGEWIWRPLVNPKRLLVTSFAATNPQGFGLMQRDRSFASYREIGANYEHRPSAWVEPGQWGSGRVELVQIPTPDETNDNVVAFWVPTIRPSPSSPSTSSTACCGRRMASARRRCPGSRRPGVARASRARMMTPVFPCRSISKAPSSRDCRPTRVSTR